jgi:hypothetical protein
VRRISGRDRDSGGSSDSAVGTTAAPGKRTPTQALVQRRADPDAHRAAPVAAESGRDNEVPPALARSIPGGLGEAFEHLLVPSVQMKGGGDSPDGVHAAADAGVQGPGSPLPFLDVIQPAFGGHDVTGIQAHTGPEASSAARTIGATAYTTGHHVAFAGAPDLHTAAHEAAHVVQQRGGVQLKGAVGETGDIYEREADAVADRVVVGESAADLLDHHASSVAGTRGGLLPGAGAPVQRDEVEGGICLPQSALSISVTEVDFFQHAVGTDVVPRQFEIGNNTLSDIRVDASWLIGDDIDAEASFEVLGLEAPLLHLAPGDRIAVQVHFRPARAGFLQSTLYLETDEGVEVVAIPLMGTGQAMPGEPGARPPQASTEEFFVLEIGHDRFVVSFELVGGFHDGPGTVKATVSPVDLSRAYQWEKKYWDVYGKEVGPDDNYMAMGTHSVPAIPHQYTFTIADARRFRGSFPQEHKEAAKGTWFFDLDGDGASDFDLRASWSWGEIWRNYRFSSFDKKASDKFLFDFLADDALAKGYTGNHSPRRSDDPFDFLKLPFDVGIGMIPIVGELVDIAEAVTGYSKWGDKLTTGQRAITALAVLIPFAGGAVLRRTVQGGVSLAEVAARMGRAEEEVVAMLRAVDNRGGDAATLRQMDEALAAGKELSKHQREQLARILNHTDVDGKVFRAVEQQAGLDAVARRGGKVAAETGPISIKRLRIVLGQAGVSPSPYHLRKASKADIDALVANGADPSNVYGWVARDGANNILRDQRGRPIITFTEQGLSSLEEAVKTFGHEAKHIKDFAAGMGTSNEALAEKAGEELWELIKKARE